MTRGWRMAVTALPFTYQCAETARTARGLPRDFPRSRHADVCRLVSRVFIGLPCPMNAAGMSVVASMDDPSSERWSRRDAIAWLPAKVAHRPHGVRNHLADVADIVDRRRGRPKMRPMSSSIPRLTSPQRRTGLARPALAADS